MLQEGGKGNYASLVALWMIKRNKTELRKSAPAELFEVKLEAEACYQRTQRGGKKPNIYCS